MTVSGCQQTYLYGDTYVDCVAVATTKVEWKDNFAPEPAEMRLCNVHTREFQEEIDAPDSTIVWSYVAALDEHAHTHALV